MTLEIGSYNKDQSIVRPLIDIQVKICKLHVTRKIQTS